MPSSTYPYWLSALIGSQKTADGYRELTGDAKTFFYGFPNTVPIYSAVTNLSEGFAPFNETQQQNAIAALNYIETITALSFIQTNEVLKSNTILFSRNRQKEDSNGYAYLPELHPLGSDIYLAVNPNNETMGIGSLGALTLIHEIGHALGLKHPHEAEEGIEDSSVLPTNEDRVANTVMSYADATNENLKFEFSHLDIAALHYIYGPNSNARDSDDTYEILTTEPNFIWDGAGVDTIDASKVPSQVTLHLTPGFHDFIGESAGPIVSLPGQITVNFGTVIENIIGSAFNDSLFGSGENNVIMGNGGSDKIDGGLGLDIAVYREPASDMTITSSKDDAGLVTWEATNSKGDKDTLLNVERLYFSDTRLALDLDDHAGSTVKLLGALLGIDGVKKPSFIGIGLEYLDAGGTYEELMILAVSHVFGETPDSRTVVGTFYQNLTGRQAPEDVVATYARLLDVGELSVLSLSLQVADHEVNLSNIDIVGLSATGIEYS